MLLIKSLFHNFRLLLVDSSNEIMVYYFMAIVV